MEMQLMLPSPALSPAVDFGCDSTSTSPYATAPSSPQSTIPFTWEQKPGLPKQSQEDDDDADFAFGQLERHSISTADDLFDGGKIKPLKPPPRLQSSNDSPRSPKSRFRKALSPRSKKNDFDPFSEALKQTLTAQTQTDQNRGRQTTTAAGRHNVSRSSSPFRGSDEENNRKISTWYHKWNLKNLFASEGSAAASKDPIKKVGRNLGLRSTGSGVSTSSRRTTAAAANEVNFTVVAEGMKGKTYLPYKSGFLGCLRFHQNGGNVNEMNSVIRQQRE